MSTVGRHLRCSFCPPGTHCTSRDWKLWIMDFTRDIYGSLFRVQHTVGATTTMFLFYFIYFVCSFIYYISILSLCLYLSFGCSFCSYLCKTHWTASVYKMCYINKLAMPLPCLKQISISAQPKSSGGFAIFAKPKSIWYCSFFQQIGTVQNILLTTLIVCAVYNLLNSRPQFHKVCAITPRTCLVSQNNASD